MFGEILGRIFRKLTLFLEAFYWSNKWILGYLFIWSIAVAKVHIECSWPASGKRPRETDTDTERPDTYSKIKCQNHQEIPKITENPPRINNNPPEILKNLLKWQRILKESLRILQKSLKILKKSIRNFQNPISFLIWFASIENSITIAFNDWLLVWFKSVVPVIALCVIIMSSCVN